MLANQEHKNMSRLDVDIAKDCTNEDSKTFKLQKGEFKFCEA